MNRPQDALYDLRMFLTTDYPCSYLPRHQARNMVADPAETNMRLYTRLAELGFRRSGDHVYRPHCRQCVACRSLRILVDQFQPNRSQQRIWKRNQDLQIAMIEAEFKESHFELFARYLAARHAGCGMDPTSRENYWSFISSGWNSTGLVEFHHDQQLLAVAVTDRLDNGLSAVYTFFDPSEKARSLGTFAILWQIAEARRLELPWVYLGYWIADCEKMRYKMHFQPHEIFLVERWGWIPGSGMAPNADWRR